MSTKRVFAVKNRKEIDMKMRQLLNIAMPFMRQSGEVGIVMNRELIVGTCREGNPDYAPGKTPRAAAQASHGKGLYGLPCARCGIYYAADLALCPVCNSAERVFPKLESPAWPTSLPRPKAVDVPLGENLSGLATISREFLAKRVQPLTVLTTAEAIPALA
jgi:hypothetical protein